MVEGRVRIPRWLVIAAMAAHAVLMMDSLAILLPLVHLACHLVDDLPHGWKSPSSTSKAQIPSDVTRLAMFLTMPSSTASATLPPRGCGGPFTLDPKMFMCEGSHEHTFTAKWR